MSYFPGQGHHQQHQQQQQGGFPPYGQQQQQQYGGQQQYYPPPQGAPQQQQGYYPPQQQYPPPQGYPPQGQGQFYQPPAYPPANQGGYNDYPPPNTYSHPTPPPNNYGHTDDSHRTPMPSYNQNAYNQGNHNAPPPPPSGPQSFGVAGYQWVPSKCTGRRKALLIGINYFGQQGQLRGCINDVKNMSTFLHERFGYAREDMVILTDDQQNPRSQPTKQNILQGMHWLTKDAQPDDSLFFHYSGHGGQTKDLDGDENDGYDETIYPVDFKVAGHIVDDEMHKVMVQSLKPGVRLTAIFDSCHSGSALDLPYLYSTQGTLKEPNLAKEAGTGLLSAVMAYGRGDIGGVASSAMGFLKKATTGRNAEEKARRTKTSPADVIQWSGSKDVQTSADAFEGGEATGAMSYAFITALKKNPQQSYQQLLTSIRSELEGKYQQKPQLSCSHPLDTRTLYVM